MLITSIPLSSENWEPLNEGEVVVFKDGAMIKSVKIAA